MYYNNYSHIFVAFTFILIIYIIEKNNSIKKKEIK